VSDQEAFEFSSQGFGNFGFHFATGIRIMNIEYLSPIVQQGNLTRLRRRETKTDVHYGVKREDAIDHRQQPVHALPGTRRDGNGRGFLRNARLAGQAARGLGGRRSFGQQVGLVQSEKLRNGFGADLSEDSPYERGLGGSERRGDIDDVQQQGGFGDFLQRGAEGLDQRGG